MLLTIDIGNTNITFGIFKMEGGKASKSPLQMWRMATNSNQTSDEYGTKMLDFLHYALLNKEDLTGVIVASVVPALNSTIRNACSSYLKKSPIIVENERFYGTKLKINVENPSEVGADRIVNSLAAIEFFGGPVIVIDFGTALTFDCINVKNEYIGGVIMPGPAININALSNNTAKLPRVELKKTKKVIGRNTVECIQSGVYFGYIGSIKKMIKDIKKELGARTKVVATGGLASVFAEDLKEIKSIMPELTLEGLRILWNTVLEHKSTRAQGTRAQVLT